MPFFINFSLAFGVKSRKMSRDGQISSQLHSPTSTTYTMPSPSQELIEYELLVRKNIETGSCDVFRNASSAHAAIILRLFCEYAQRSIHILCGKLNDMVYADLTPYLEGAVRRGVDVKVLTVQGEDSLQSHCVVEYLKSVGKLHCLCTTDDILNVPHFAIVDNKMFRVETDSENKQAIVVTNIAANDTEKQEAVSVRESAFAQLWDFASA